MTDIVEIVVTGPADDMPGLVDTLVEERLVACAQLMTVGSTYRWQGRVERAPETRACLHTTAALVDAVTARVEHLHPYEVPAVLAIPVLSANPGYLAWVEAEVQAPETTRPADPAHRAVAATD